MPRSSNQDSAILYHNAENTRFLIDTPHSIALAQKSVWPSSAHDPLDESLPRATGYLSSFQSNSISPKRWLLSTPPLESPFPSTEPKSHGARARVLEKIPLSERRYHGEFIQPLVESALTQIRAGYEGSEWCLPRKFDDDMAQRRTESLVSSAGRQSHSHSTRKRRWKDTARDAHLSPEPPGGGKVSLFPPSVILSSTAVNIFESFSDLNASVVKNVSSGIAMLAIGSSSASQQYTEYIIPPRSNFVLCTLPLSQSSPNSTSGIIALDHPIPAIPPNQKFNLLLFDPPWPNKSVRRSGHYQTHSYSEMDLLTQRLRDILRVHSSRGGDSGSLETPSSTATSHKRCPRSQSHVSLASVWITNAEKTRRAAYEALTSTGFRIIEEWVWVKTTVNGQPICAINGLWRKPYEILVIGRADQPESSVTADSGAMATETDDLLGIDPAGIRRRVIAAVPDLHSRKPNLKKTFERVFFQKDDEEPGSDIGVQSYSALEVFARNLTAGWWSCGNEVLKFNARECWVEELDR